MDENLEFHLRDLAADFADFIQRQFAGKNDPAQPHLLPEFNGRPVNGVGLDRQMNLHIGEVFPYQHDQTRIGHNQRVRPHIHHRLQIANEGFQLGVVRRNVDDHVEFFPQLMGFIDAQLQVFMVEFVVAHAQRVTRLASINGVCAISEGVTHIFQRSRRGKEFRFKHDVLVLMTGQIRHT